MHLEMLTASKPEHWAWFPLLIQRARRFKDKYDPYINWDTFERRIRAFWAVESPLLGIWVVFGEHQGRKSLVGHFIITVEQPAEEKPYAFIWQGETDERVSEIVDKAVEEVKAWVLGFGVTEMRMTTQRKEEPFFKRFGFVTRHVTLKLDLDKEKVAGGDRH